MQGGISDTNLGIQAGRPLDVTGILAIVGIRIGGGASIGEGEG